MAANTKEKETVDFGTELFFIEDPEFYAELKKKTTDKANIDDFSFGDAQINPGKVKIRKRDEDWETTTSSGRGRLKGKKGDFILIDQSGNKLKVTANNFNAVYEKVIG